MDSNIAVLTCAFNEEKLIVPCIEQFFHTDFHHLILVSETPWHGDYKADNTYSIARNTYNRDFRVNVGRDNFKNQAEQLNHGLDVLCDFDWVLIVDADEFYTKGAIQVLLGSLNSNISALRAPNMEVYWGDTNHRIRPQQTDSPIVCVRPNVRFLDKRQLEDGLIANTNATLHHLSYVRSNEDMLKKINSFEHSDEFNLNQWYEFKWLEWQQNEMLEDLHPVVPKQFRNTIWCPIPEELDTLINDNRT